MWRRALQLDSLPERLHYKYPQLQYVPVDFLGSCEMNNNVLIIEQVGL